MHNSNMVTLNMYIKILGDKILMLDVIKVISGVILSSFPLFV